MTVIDQGPFGAIQEFKGKDVYHRGVPANCGSHPFFSSVHYTTGYQGEIAREVSPPSVATRPSASSCPAPCRAVCSRR